MTIKIMALVNEKGEVVNKIVMDDSKPFRPPAGWSMHEWTDADEEAYREYMASRRGQ